MADQNALNDLILKVEVAIVFLEGLKVDKNKKKEKEGLIQDLKLSLQRCRTSETYDDVNAQQLSTDDTYDDTGIEQTYDDNQINQQPTYDDTGPTYDDTTMGGDHSSNKTGPWIMDTECESLTNPKKAEMLELKTRRIMASSWLKRWCVLKNGVFYMYETAKDKKPKEAFHIRSMVFSIRDDITKESKRKDRCFEIKNEEKSFEFCAPDLNSLNQWKSELGLPSTNPRTVKDDIRGSQASLQAASKRSSSRTALPEGDTYDDTGIEQNYDDNQINPQPTYDDTGPTYDDTTMGGDFSSNTTSVGIMDTECESLTNPKKAEMLELKTRRIMASSWQKRWCVLKNGVFYMYETAKDKKPKEAFHIRSMVFNIRDDITKESKRRDRCFEIKNEEKSFEFCCPDANSVSQWRSALGLSSGMKAKSDDSLPDLNDGNKGKGAGLLSNIFKPKKSTSDVTKLDDTAQTYDENVVAPSYDDNSVDSLPPPPIQPIGEETYEEYSGDEGAPTFLPPTPSPGLGKKNMPLPPVPGNGSLKSKNMPLPPASNDSPDSELNRRLSSKSVSMPEDGLPTPPREMMPLPPPPDAPEEEKINKDEDYENLYQGMWDCEASDNNELSFKRGEIVHILSREFDEYGWWVAENSDSTIGLVPKNHIMEAYEI